MPFMNDLMYKHVSALVSSLDGIQYHTVQPQPGPFVPGVSLGIANSLPQYDGLEFSRRKNTFLASPSATLTTATSGYAVAINTPNSGFFGWMQGAPFTISAGLSAQLTSNVSTTSNQIRKVLVTMSLPGQPWQSAIGLGSAGLQIIVGSAMATSANAVTTGTHSYFDYVPLPVPSAGEIPVGWINIPNGFIISTTVSGPMLWSDFRALQGLNMSALMQSLPQP